MTRKNRLRLSVIGMGVLLLLGATAAFVHSQGLTVHAQETLTVFDALGKRVGKVVGVDDYLRNPVVALNADGALLVLEVHVDRFAAANIQGATVGFGSTDCSGPPFLFGVGAEQLASLSQMPIPASLLVDQMAWVPNGPIQSVVLRSYLGDPLDRSVCLELAGDTEQLTVPMRFVADLSTQFTPPFAVR